MLHATWQASEWNEAAGSFWSAAIVISATLIAGAVLLLAAWHDLLSRTVPNWMSGVIALCGAAAAAADHRLALSCGLGFVIFAAAALCWRRGWLGGADVKLLGAIAILLPPALVAPFAVAMSAAGAAHAVLYLFARRHVAPPRWVPPRGPRSLLSRGLRAEQWRISRGGPLPYACAIAFGFLFAVL